MTYSDILSIPKTAARCKAEGIPLLEKGIRRFVKDGSLLSIQTGTKTLIYFPNVVAFIKRGNRKVETAESGGIRRIDE